MSPSPLVVASQHPQVKLQLTPAESINTICYRDVNNSTFGNKMEFHLYHRGSYIQWRVIYKMEGHIYNGRSFIHWRSFIKWRVVYTMEGHIYNGGSYIQWRVIHTMEGHSYNRGSFGPPCLFNFLQDPVEHFQGNVCISQRYHFWINDFHIPVL